MSHHYEMYRLRPVIAPHAPDPGVYWAKNVGSNWTLLYPDGEEHSFMTVSDR
ncbi:MAG: hypothetical protein KKA42_13735 [candidate division Zixibacteria bacterium]|nr:hypothetical protein [candidate division Zixibacteria bacterium]